MDIDISTINPNDTPFFPVIPNTVSCDFMECVPSTLKSTLLDMNYCEVDDSLCLNNRCSVGCSVGSPIAKSISTVLHRNLNSNAVPFIPHFEHLEIAFLAFALSCLMLSIGFFVNITLNHEITKSPVGSALARFSTFKENSPELNSYVVYNNENFPGEMSNDAWHILKDLRVKIQIEL